jgi:hypothetical protein
MAAALREQRQSVVPAPYESTPHTLVRDQNLQQCRRLLVQKIGLRKTKESG